MGLPKRACRCNQGYVYAPAVSSETTVRCGALQMAREYDLDKKSPRIVVLMSTYNGRKYLREQMDSLLAQTMDDICIFVHDDGSVDGTVDILQEYADKYSQVVFYESKKAGYPECFFKLLWDAPEAEYYAFSDQDDYWMPEKLAVAVANLDGRPEPALYCSAKMIVDEQLNPLGRKDSKPLKGIQNALLKVNQASGCTMVFNAALRNIILQYHPKKAPYHDSWVFKVAMLFGEIIYDDNPYMKYRQHASNTDGAHAVGYRLLCKRLKSFDLTFKRYRQQRSATDYAQELLEAYENQISEEDRAVIYHIAHARERLKSRWKLFFMKGLDTSPFYEYVWLKSKILLGWI